MPFEYTPPKYAQVVIELQRRIETGQYEPGSALPSEHQLMREFGAARPTIVRALSELRQQGWIESQQGKGRFVRGRPALERAGHARTGQSLLERPESTVDAKLLDADMGEVTERVATLLRVPSGAKAFVRRHVVRRDGNPAELVTVWLPAALSEGTDLGSPEPLADGVRHHLEARKNVRFDHVVEQITARLPTAEQQRTLAVSRRVPVLTVYAAARDASGQTLLVLDVVLPADRAELEDAYPLS